MDDEVTQDGLARELPGWEVWQGVNGMAYARWLGSSPPIVVRGEDWTDLRDQVRRAISRTATV